MKYMVPVSYTVDGHITVEANSPEEAIELARNKDIPEDIECRSVEYDFAYGDDPDAVEIEDDEED